MSKSIAVLTLSLLLAAYDAPAQEHWTTSWYAAPQPAWDATFALPMNVPTNVDNATVRETVRLSAGGQRIRLVFSNRYGHTPVKLGAVRAGPSDDPRAARALTLPDSPVPPSCRARR